MTLRTGGRREPNVPAPMAELYDGLESKSQNAWPSPNFDILAINNLFKPFLSAGFYYKTFMGPTKKSWMFFEPFIRRAAGLGVASTEPDPDRYEKVNAFCDVLIVGGGPAGLSAALAAGRTGARVTLADQMPQLGGALLDEPAGGASDHWLKSMLAELERLPNVRLMPRTTVFGQFDGGTFGLAERVADHKAQPSPFEPRQRYIVLRAQRVVIAAGAIERPIPFGNNDKPGVMLAGAVRSYLNRYGVIAGRNVVVFTCNHSAYRTAFDLKAAGATVTLVDARALDGATIRHLEAKGLTVYAGHAVAEATGGKTVSGAAIAPFDIATGKCTGGFTRVACDLIAVSGGWDPQLHLATHKGARPVWNNTIHCLVPGAEGTIEHFAGAMKGSFSTTAAVSEGFAAGAKAAELSGAKGNSGSAPKTDGLPDGALASGFAPVFDVPPPQGLAEKKRFIDLQNDVSASDVKLAHLEGYVSVEHLKRYTTLGMATEQGKTSNVIALAQMAKLRGLDIPEVGTTGWRPPYTPVAIATLAGHETDHHVKPVRRTPFHFWNEKAKCVFLDTGLWKRPWYYPHGDEDINGAYRRETKAVRETVGVVDVSTLGKIDVQGPDAAEFLNRVYVNGWKNSGGRQGALRHHAARGRFHLRRRHHLAPRRGSLLPHHHDGRSRQGDGASGMAAANRLAGSKSACHLRHRSVGRRRGRGAERAQAARRLCHRYRHVERGLPVHGRARRKRPWRRAAAHPPHLLLGRARLRGIHAIGLWRGADGSAGREGQARTGSCCMASRRSARCASRRAMSPATRSTGGRRWRTWGLPRWLQRRSPISAACSVIAHPCRARSGSGWSA